MVTIIQSKKFYSYQPQKSLFLFLFGVALSGCGSGNSSNSGTPQKGLRPAILNISGGDVFDFGSQLIGTSTEQSFTVTNSGDKTATDLSGTFYFSLSFAFKDGSYPGTGGTCGGSIVPGASCTVIVVFTPKTTGQAQSILEVDYNDGTAPKGTTHPVLNGRGI